jgi:hypothetical protein
MNENIPDKIHMATGLQSFGASDFSQTAIQLCSIFFAEENCKTGE